MTITLGLLREFERRFDSDSSNSLIAGAIQTVGIDDASLRQEVVRRHNFIFSDVTEKGSPTAQKSSGRCWMFAALNSIRQITMEKLNVESFEFSETYLYFYDKIEKANTFLERIIETAGMPLQSREVYDLLKAGTYDGGYYEYFRSLIRKYGIVPKTVMPETFESQKSYMFTKQMDMRLVRAAKDIRNAAAGGKPGSEIREIQKAVLYDIYNICVKVLGRPVEKFDLVYNDKDKKFHRDPALTPLEFYEKYIGGEAMDKLVLIADPRGIHPEGRWLQCSKIKSVWEGECSRVYNVELEELKKSAIASIKAGIPVWFACDVGKDLNRELGILDSELYNYDETLTPMGGMSKAERFSYRIAALTHAMSFVGVDLDENGRPVRWMVENSWGEKVGRKGIFSMSDKWFDDHNYSVVIDRKFLSEKYLAGLDKPAIELDYFDPAVELMENRD